MPLIRSETYKPALVFRNNHFNTIFTSLRRKVKEVSYFRERIPTPDADFLDIDWSLRDGDYLLIALHGLEGSSDSQYIRGITRFFNKQHWDVAAMNFRGCSGETNKQLRSYHMAATEDLDLLVQYCLKKGYRGIALVGYSLGGNVVLRYLGEQGSKLPRLIKGGAAVSVPVDLPSAVEIMHSWYNMLYMKNFVRQLNQKLRDKQSMFPAEVAPVTYPKRLVEFDELYTAPVHGFKNAADYYRKASSVPVLENISVPTLLINAKDDSFLSTQCFPIAEAEYLHDFYLEIPKWGGHVGFGNLSIELDLWTEQRIFSFFKEKILY